jgi:hypothetical protein
VFQRKTKFGDDQAEQMYSAPPRRVGAQLFSLLTVLLVAVAAVLFTFGSSNQNGFPKTMDQAYLTDASASSASIGQEIFPLKLGQIQTYEVVSDIEKRRLTNKITEIKQQQGGTLALMQTSVRDDGKNKPLTNRIYAVSAKGLALVALGGARATPPLPLIRFPVTPDSLTSWQGTFQTGKTKLPGAAVVRVSGPDTIPLGKKEVTAYRLDMTVVTKNKNNTLRQNTTLWLTPHIGMVREQSVINDQPFLCELQQP